MPTKEITYVLDGGQIVTVKDVMLATGLTKNACYFRLRRSTDPEVIFKIPPQTYKGMRLYLLDDGSAWTADQLSKHLGCKRSTASTRLSVMNGDSKRILAPLKKPKKDEEIFLTDSEIRQRVSKRMYEDSTGFWKTFNNIWR